MPRRVRGLLSSGLAVCMWLGVLQLATGCGSDDDADHNHEHGHEHGHDHEHGHEPVGPPSGATCPPGSTLTYANFGKDFMSKYCLSCHSEKVTGDARRNAPADHNFDTYAEIELMLEHIDQMAAFGPDNQNKKMPPADANPKPTDAEREQLGEWIACDAPEE